MTKPAMLESLFFNPICPPDGPLLLLLLLLVDTKWTEFGEVESQQGTAASSQMPHRLEEAEPQQPIAKE